MIASDSLLPDAAMPTGAALDNALLSILERAGVTSLSPPEIAQSLRPDGDWHAMLNPVRRAAIELALKGRLIIYRKGKPVDPKNFSGVYRIGLPRQD